MKLSQSISSVLLACFLLVIGGTIVHHHECDHHDGMRISKVTESGTDAGCTFCKVVKDRLVFSSGRDCLLLTEVVGFAYASHAPDAVSASTIAPCMRGPPGYGGH